MRWGKLPIYKSQTKPESRMEAQNVLPRNGSRTEKFLSLNRQNHRKSRKQHNSPPIRVKSRRLTQFRPNGKVKRNPQTKISVQRMEEFSKRLMLRSQHDFQSSFRNSKIGKKVRFRRKIQKMTFLAIESDPDLKPDSI